VSSEATYTPDASYGTVTGVHVFTRWAKDDKCVGGWQQSAGSWVLTVLAPFNSGTIGTIGSYEQTVCYGNPNLINAIMDEKASGGNEPTITYQWRHSYAGATATDIALGSTNAVS
jgi:hypothetical protein